VLYNRHCVKLILICCVILILGVKPRKKSERLQIKCFSRFKNDKSIAIEIDDDETEITETEIAEKETKKHGKLKLKRKDSTEDNREKKKRKVHEGSTTSIINEEENNPYFPFNCEKKLHLRCSPKLLVSVLSKLTKEQKKVVTEMGFGKSMCLSIYTIPTCLGYWLLKNYDHTTDMFNDGKCKFKVTDSLINEVLGIPIGRKTVDYKLKPNAIDPVVAEWRSQYGENLSKKLYIREFFDSMLLQTDCGRIWKLNFLVSYMTAIAEAMLSNTVNQRFLRSITKKEDVSKLNWCEYIISCLRRTKITWLRDENELYSGPLLVMAVRNYSLS